MKEEEKAECFLCGNPATTKDHIPPLGIFPKPRPSNLITVPACRDCNERSKLDDEYFRLMVAATSGDSPNSLITLRQRIIPKIQKRPGLMIDFLRSVRRAAVHSKGGIYLGNAPVVRYRRPRIQAVINKIVRGLFFRHSGRRLAVGYKVGDYLQNPPIEPAFQEAIATLPLYKIGDGSVFSYRYCLTDQSGFESVWYLMFYNDSNLFVTGTGPAEPSSLPAQLIPAK